MVHRNSPKTNHSDCVDSPNNYVVNLNDDELEMTYSGTETASIPAVAVTLSVGAAIKAHIFLKTANLHNHCKSDVARFNTAR